MGAVVSSDDDDKHERDEDEQNSEEEISHSDDSESEESEESSDDAETGDEEEDDDTSFFGDSDSSDETETESEEEYVPHEVIITEGILLGVGSPLLDISAKVGNGYLERFQLQAGTKVISGEKQINIYPELCSWFPTEYLPGGSALTTIRVAQWMLHLEKATSIIGAIGLDEKAARLIEACEKTGIRHEFYVQEDEPTGALARLYCDNTTTELVHLAAGNTYSKQRHLDLGATWSLVDQAQYYFIPGYFLTVCPETVLKIGEHASENGKTFALSVGDPKLCRLFKDTQLAVLRYVDFLFANKEAALSFAEENDFQTTEICEIARKLCLLPKVNSNKPRVVVVTQGCEATVVARGYDEVHEFEVEDLTPAQLPHGVGDFFTGGFLSQLVQGHGLERCVEGSHFAARQLILSGQKLDGECPFE